MMDMETLIGIVSITTILTTASTYVIVNRMGAAVKKDICGKIDAVKEDVNKLMIRVGIIEGIENHHE